MFDLIKSCEKCLKDMTNIFSHNTYNITINLSRDSKKSEREKKTQKTPSAGT